MSESKVYPVHTLPAERVFRRILGWLTLRAEHFAPFIVAVVLMGMFLVAMFWARYKALWYDELLSLSVAKLPHISDIWSFTKTGADGQPPLYYCLLHVTIRVFGNDPWGIRLPSTLGYLVFC